jgi:hypothetical protein
MSNSQDIGRLELELETHKREFREDTSRIKDKIQETKAELSPTNLVQKRVLLFTGMAFLLGFAVGFIFKRPREAVEQVGKPVARTLLTSAGKQAATSAAKQVATRAIEGFFG